MQTLAIASCTEAELASRMRVSSDLVRSLLNDLGKQTNDGWVLRDAMYKDVKIWDWKHYTSAERTTVISRAAEAFDRFGLAADDPIRTRLTHPEKRNKAERFDTSPLSLNVPQTADRAPEGESLGSSNLPIIAESPQSSRLTSPIGTSKIEHQPERKRNGLLSSGKRSSASSSQKRKADVPHDHEDRSVKTATVLKGKAVKKSLSCSATNVIHQSDEDTGSSRIESTGVSKKVRRLGPESSDLARSAKRNPGASERSQTSSAMTATVAPSSDNVRKESHTENLHFGDRTSSLTSSSSDRSTDSKFTTSTAPSSVADEELPQPRAPPRSKFLSAKKFDGRIPSRPVSNISSPTQCSVQHEDSKVPTTCESGSLSTKKRKIDDVDSHKVFQKRHQTIDLREMARNYKRLYPEYRKLHDEVLRNTENDELHNEFMKLHRQMLKWKTTLFEEDSKH